MTETATTPDRDYRTAAEREVAERFPRDVAGHELTVLHDDGLYRHLRCSKPGSSFYWFEIVTWPGSLAFRGDMDLGLVFSRVPDMLTFFRSHRYDGRINPGYWSEKLPDAGRSVRTHSEEVLREQFEEAVAGYEQHTYPELRAAYDRARAAGHASSRPAEPTSPAALRDLYTEYQQEDRLRFADEARELLRKLEQAGAASDMWEWDLLTDWAWTFLWACHAIVWAIEQYDQQKATSCG